jgi:minor extracellular serine protease Vpr
MKKRIFLLFAVLLIFIVVFGAGDNVVTINGKSDKDPNAANIKAKLIGQLKEVVEIYKEHPKLTLLNVANHRIAKFNVLANQAGLPLKQKLNKTVSHNRTFPNSKAPKVSGLPMDKADSLEMGSFLIDTLILPEVQERWGNPPYDVIRCNIEIYDNPDILKSYNLKIRSVSTLGKRRIVNVELAGTDIEKVAENPSVSRIEAVLKREKTNDRGTLNTGASRIRMKQGDLYTKGYTGKGVIVGVIDTGIDWTHEDFIDPVTGTSRILYIWDTSITTPGKTPSDVFGGNLVGLSYGTVWTKAEIDGGSCTEVDSQGHGTHVSGSAAGNGYATGKYTGMAPNADIVFVKGLDNNGVLFVYEMASQLGKPCSVNMSYGIGYTFHAMSMVPGLFPADGTSLIALMFQGWNTAYGAGHIPVKSAGNDGHWNTYTDLDGYNPYMTGGFHSGTTLSSSSTHTMVVPDYSALWNSWGWGTPSRDDYATIQFGVWYNSPIQITITAPNGGIIGPMVHGTFGVDSDSLNKDGVIIYSMDYPAASNGHYYATFTLADFFGIRYFPYPGNWKVKVDPIGVGSGYVDMWCADFDVFLGTTYLLDVVPHVKYSGNKSHSNYIIDEGASPYMISVGNWVTRDVWTDIDGSIWTFTKKPWLGDISNSSSPGPARNRRVKPDIAAPGEIIASTAGKDGYWPNWGLVDSRHGVMSGTSMAAPHVTGGIALILEKFPGKSVNNIKNTIAGWAKRDAVTSTRGQNAFGYGKFSVLGLNDPPVALLTVDRTEVILDNEDRDVNFDGSASYDPEDFPIKYKYSVNAEVFNSTSASKVQSDSLNYTLSVDGAKATLEPDPDVAAKYTVSFLVNDTIVNSTSKTKVIEAKFYPVYPPVNFVLQRVENDYIFFKEYINTLSWEANLENKTDIKSYNLYRKVKGLDTEYILIASLDSTVFSYEERGLQQDELYSYQITSVNYRGKESDPVSISN